MLQQTQVKTVLPYWNRWMRELPTIQSLADASPEKIHKLWEGLGYYTRVRNMQKAAQQIVADCRRRGNESQIKKKSETPYVVSYKFPDNFDDILALPGIGRYTAGAICSIAFNQPTPILDGNVIRVLTRLFGIATNPREKETNALLWQLAEALVRNSKLETRNPKRSSSHLNQSLMELGALVCAPRQPKCNACPVARHCVAFEQGRIHLIPNLGRRTTPVARHFAAIVLKRHDRFLVRQRPANVVNAHLWEFPNIELPDGRPNLRSAARKAAGFPVRELRPFCEIRHSITRYRITLNVFKVEGNHLPDAKIEGRWLKLSELMKLSFPSAHKKILAQLSKQ